MRSRSAVRSSCGAARTSRIGLMALSRCRRLVAVNVAGNRRHVVADALAQVRSPLEPARPTVDCPAHRPELGPSRYPVLSENSIRPGFAPRTPIYTSGKRAARSLLCALGFPVRPQIFPALAAREFCSQPIEFPPESRSASVISKPEIGEIPCIFPVIRESDKRRGVHYRLPAQPD